MVHFSFWNSFSLDLSLVDLKQVNVILKGMIGLGLEKKVSFYVQKISWYHMSDFYCLEFWP